MSEPDDGPKLSGPVFWDIVCRLGNAGPQWRPEADKVEEELTAYMRKLYPQAPSNVAGNYARAFVTKALQAAAAARASGRTMLADRKWPSARSKGAA